MNLGILRKVIIQNEAYTMILFLKRKACSSIFLPINWKSGYLTKMVTEKTQRTQQGVRKELYRMKIFPNLRKATVKFMNFPQKNKTPS